MSIAARNVLREVQCALEEAGLYSGAIDGLFGRGSRKAWNAFIKESHATIAPFEVRDFKQGIKEIQKGLKALGFYPGYIDGIWGSGSRVALRRALTAYVYKHDLPKYDLVWSDLVSLDFTDKVLELTEEHGYPADFPDWLMASMHFETGGTFSPSIQNGAGAHYFGLIQFGRAAAKDLGTTTTALRAMTQLEQLEWVFKYFNMWRKRGKEFNQLEDIYLSIFYPAAVGRDADKIIFKKGTIGYRQNRGLDLDRNGYLLVGEVCRKIYDVYYRGKLTKNRREL